MNQEFVFANNNGARLNVKDCIIKCFVVFALLTFILGIVYPYATTFTANILFTEKAQGSLIKDKQGNILGSKYLGQDFSKDKRLFESRPSASSYSANLSAASNFAVHSDRQISLIKERAQHVQNKFNIKNNIPSDMLTASASGLDPHISYKNAVLQSKYVAKINNLSLNDVQKLIDKNSKSEFLSKDKIVNVVLLNIDLLNLIDKGKSHLK